MVSPDPTSRDPTSRRPTSGGPTGEDPTGASGLAAPESARPAPPEATSGADDGARRPGRTRVSATYLGVGVGLLILLLVVIFIAQNTQEVSVHYLGSHFHMAVGLVVLASAVAGGLIVLLVSAARVLQLRMMARRHRQADRA